MTVYSQVELQKYQVKKDAGEFNTVYVVPSNYLIFKKQYDEIYEYGVFYIKGSNATHYVGPIYSTGKSLFGLKIYPGANKVWKAEMELIEKSGNLQETTFEDIGEKFNQLIIFRDNSIELGDFEYERMNITNQDDIFVKSVVDKIKKLAK